MPHRTVALTLFVVLVQATISISARAAQLSSPANCREWHECRELALAAADRHDYEAFHDLAWRTVQTGPQRDPDLMYLLARAQCLSGRPHDALIMLQRLAEMGVATDAIVNADFERSRALAGWAEVEALIERVRTASAAVDEPAPKPTAAAKAPTSRNRPPRPAARQPASASPSTPASSTAPAPVAPPVPTPPVAPPVPTPPVALPVPTPTVSPEPSAPTTATLPAPSAPAAPAPVTSAPGTSAPGTPALGTPASGNPALGTPAPGTSTPGTSAPRASRVSPPSTVSAARPAPAGLPAFKPLRVEEAVRVSTPHFAAGGLAYDSVSRRFVVGDLHGGRLIVVSEGSDHAVDLVRADSAGFHEIRAIEIDWRRGDLWVVSATPNSEWSIHRLQLLSGRPLKAIPASKRLEPLTLVDLAVTPGGTVLILDSVKSRLLVLRPRADTLEAGPQMRIDDASSVTATDEEGVAYVAHRRGISRVDIRTRTTAPVAAPRGLDMAGIERLRWHGTGLVAAQAVSDGSQRIVHFELNGAKRAITAGTVIDTSLPATPRPPFLTVSGDELSYLVAAGAEASGQSDRDASDATGEFIVRRIRLR